MLNADIAPIAADSFTRHRGPVTSVAAIPGHAAAVAVAYDGAVSLFDLNAGTVELLGYHGHLANHVTVSDDGRWAASSSSDYNVHIWDLRERTLALVLRGHSDDVEGFTFVDERTGVSASRDRRIIVWDLVTGAIRRTIQGHEKDVLSVACRDGLEGLRRGGGPSRLVVPPGGVRGGRASPSSMSNGIVRRSAFAAGWRRAISCMPTACAS